MASSTLVRKIFPSPTLPVRAAVAIVSTAFSVMLSNRTISSFILGIKIDGVFASAVDFRMTLLAPMASGFDHGHSFDADFVQSIFHSVEFRRLDDRFDLCHDIPRFLRPGFVVVAFFTMPGQIQSLLLVFGRHPKTERP
jgi:hypothetical protein